MGYYKFLMSFLKAKWFLVWGSTQPNSKTITYLTEYKFTDFFKETVIKMIMKTAWISCRHSVESENCFLQTNQS